MDEEEMCGRNSSLLEGASPGSSLQSALVDACQQKDCPDNLIHMDCAIRSEFTGISAARECWLVCYT
jgi:hypothetical protein